MATANMTINNGSDRGKGVAGKIGAVDSRMRRRKRRTAEKGAPCGACKFLRRKCLSDCPFQPHFSSNSAGEARFSYVHKIFGTGNVTKLLKKIPQESRQGAVRSLCFEAKARVLDPTYGYFSEVVAMEQQLRSQVDMLQGKAQSLKGLSMRGHHRQQQQQQMGSSGGYHQQQQQGVGFPEAGVSSAVAGRSSYRQQKQQMGMGMGIPQARLSSSFAGSSSGIYFHQQQGQFRIDEAQFRIDEAGVSSMCASTSSGRCHQQQQQMGIVWAGVSSGLASSASGVYHQQQQQEMGI